MQRGDFLHREADTSNKSQPPSLWVMVKEEAWSPPPLAPRDE